MQTLSELKDKRILFRHNDTRQIGEGRVQEFAGNGEYVCIGFDWHEASKISVIEVLPDYPKPDVVSISPAPAPITILLYVPGQELPPGTVVLKAPQLPVAALETTGPGTEAPTNS